MLITKFIIEVNNNYWESLAVFLKVQGYKVDISYEEIKCLSQEHGCLLELGNKKSKDITLNIEH